MSGNSYSWQARNEIAWTDEDITDAAKSLSADDMRKTVATLSADCVSRPAVLRHFAALAGELDGLIKSEYGLSITVPKDAKEVHDTAVYALKYSEKHAELRDQRAAEQGVIT